MRSSLLLLLLPVEAAFAAVLGRQDTSGCCFYLNSAGYVNETVEESHTGELFLAGSFQQGGFCLDESAKTIKDTLGNNCFMRAPDYQFECYSGIVGTTVFDIAASTGSDKLVYDNGTGTFLACPLADQSYEIYSTAKTNTTGCLNVALVLANQTTKCTPSTTTFIG
jgi:hypothetical protein